MKNKWKEIRVELIPTYIPEKEFEEKKEIVQNLIVKILLEAHLDEQKEKKRVRLPPPSDLTNGQANTIYKNKAE